MAATAQEILEGLVEIVNERAGVPTDYVERDKSFADDLGLDELNMLEVVMSIEERFDVTIPDEHISQLKTVGDAVDEILKLQS